MIIENGQYTVYCHTNKTNGKKYVGITKLPLERRWRNGTGYIQCTLFYNAIKKYGWDGFDHEIIASNLTEQEACTFERLLIDKLNLMDSNFGYNCREGGSVNSGFSEESIERMSKAKIGMYKGEKNPRYGTSWTPEMREKIIQQLTGRHLSKEHIEKLRKVNSGINNPFYGKTHSQETRDKIRAKQTWQKGKGNPMYGKNHTEETKKKIREKKPKVSVVAYNKETGSISIYVSMREADRSSGVSRANIKRCCDKKYQQSGGYIWRYMAEYQEKGVECFET